VPKKLGGDAARAADLTDQRYIPYHMTSCSAYKPRGRSEEGTCGGMAFVFPSNHYAQWSPAVPEMAKNLPADGK